MIKQYIVSIHKSSSTAYMMKRLGGVDNIVEIQKYDELFAMGCWTNYKITLKDSSLITSFSRRWMRIQPI